MDRYSDVVQNENGRAVPGASILIVGANGQPATIYADRQGTSLENPIITDFLGRWSFCAADGLYTVRVSIGGVQKAELRDVRLEDPDDGFASLARSTGATLIGMANGSTLQANYTALAATVAGLSNYSLPIASASTLGGVRIGTGLAINASGILSLNYSYTLPNASSTVLGGIRIGSGLAIDASGIASATYSLPTASATVLGGVKVGTGLAINASGVLSATGTAAGSVASVNSVAPDGAGNVLLTTDNLQESATPTNRWFTAQRVRDVALTGLSLTTNAVIAATDTVISSLGKLQAQVSANKASIDTNTTALSGKQDRSEEDASNGYVGLTGFAINIKNTAGTFVSKIANAATAARTYTLPDKDGTVAMISDIPAQQNAGALAFLGAATVSTAVAQIDFLNIFTADYDKYFIEILGVQPSANDTLSMRVANAGVVLSAANYYIPATNGSTGGNASSMNIGLANTVGGAYTATVINANDAVNVKAIDFRGMTNTTNGYVATQSGYSGATKISGFRLFWASASNFTRGTIRVYGVRNQ